ncbi:MAG TPA: porin [Burkholderiaceae bacterium]
MKKTTIALGLCLAGGAANAQTADGTNVQMYGAFDIGVGYSQHSLSQDYNFPVGVNPVITHFADNAVTGMFNGGIGGSNIGFKGTEDLGGGLKATFKLEAGFNSFDGALNNGVASVADNPSSKQITANGDSSLAGQLFNREATVGLSSSNWGSIAFGRNNSLGYDALIAYDVMGGSYVFSPFGYFGSYGAGGFTEDYRVDNSVKYRLKLDNGFNVGALYKLGGQAGASSAQSELQLTAGYDVGRFSVQGLYSKTNDAISASNSATMGAVALTVTDNTAYMLGLAYKGDGWKVSGGYERLLYQNPSNPAADMLITSVFGVPVAGTPSVTAYTIEKRLNVYFAGVSYDLTPALTLAGAAYDIEQNDYSGGLCVASDTASFKCSGSNTFYSLMGTYKLSKRSQLYAGYQYSKVDGGYAAGFLHDSNSFLGIGMRHAF